MNGDDGVIGIDIDIIVVIVVVVIAFLFLFFLLLLLLPAFSPNIDHKWGPQTSFHQKWGKLKQFCGVYGCMCVKKSVRSITNINTNFNTPPPTTTTTNLQHIYFPNDLSKST